MSKISQFKTTIERLQNIITFNLPGNIIAGQIIHGLEYCIEIESGQSNDISLLRKLCAAGLPYRDIESFDQETLNSVYESYEKMKKLLKEQATP
jgi:hypothetical protein